VGRAARKRANSEEKQRQDNSRRVLSGQRMEEQWKTACAQKKLTVNVQARQKKVTVI
jgi:hypothetical protein